MDATPLILSTEAAWSRHGRDPDAFPQLAAELLERHLPDFSREALLEHLSQNPDLPEQHDPRSVFGEPPITLARGDGFHLDVYFWLNPATSIHNHIFTGAFAVLDGCSLHVEHALTVTSRLDHDDLLLCDSSGARLLELLTPGDVRPIARGLDFVHQVAHLHRPTLSLVLRTSHPAPDARSYTFLMPHIGFAGLHRLPPHARRQLELIRTLFSSAASEAWPFLQRALTHATPFTAAWLLRAAYFCCHDLDGLRRIAPNNTPWTNALLTSLDLAGRHPVHVSSLTEPGHRLLYLLTAASQDRQRLIPILQAFCDPEPWEDAVTTWILQLAQAGRTGFWPMAPHTALIPALLRGEDPTDALSRHLNIPPTHVGAMLPTLLDPLTHFTPLSVLRRP